METRLERCIYLSMAILTLSVMVVIVAPSVAQAKQYQSTVVTYGESLWSISAERLDRDATAEQIADEVQDIYALNRGRIGSDPNQISVGQELVLPAEDTPFAAGPGTIQPSAGTAAREDAGAETEDPAPGEERSAGRGRTPELAAKPLSLPDAPAAGDVPAVITLTTEGSPATLTLTGYVAELRTDGRKMIGLGIIALTYLVAALALWKLPMRREVGYAKRWRPTTAGVDQMYSSHASYAPSNLPEHTQRISPGRHGDASVSSLSAASGLGPPAHRLVGLASSSRRARTARQRTRLPHHGRMRGTRRPLRARSAVGAHKPPISRSPRAVLRDRRRPKPLIGQGTIAARRVDAGGSNAGT